MTTTTLPRLSYNTQVLEVEPGHLQVRSPTRAVRFRGQPDVMDQVAMVLRRLDGTVPLKNVLDAVPVALRERVEQVVVEAEQIGIVARASVDHPGGLTGMDLERFASQEAFFANFPCREWQAPVAHHGNVEPSVVQARLRRASIALLGVGRLGSSVFDGLARMGIGKILAVDDAAVSKEDTHATVVFNEAMVGRPRVAVLADYAQSAHPDLCYMPCETCDLRDVSAVESAIEGADLVLLCADDYNPLIYRSVNKAAISKGITWTSYRLSPTEVQLGPSVVPYQTPCFQCYELRRAANAYPFDDYAALQAYLCEHAFVSGHLNFAPGASLAALEVLKIITQITAAPTYGHVVAINLLTLKSRISRILKVPRCPDCTRTNTDRVPVKTWMPRKLDGAE